MASITIICLCLLIGCVAVKAAEEKKEIVHFDCRRNSQSCVGVDCIGPACAACPSGKHGYDCSLSYTATVDNDKPECLCKNGGTCFNDNTYKCECSAQYYGDKCQYDRMTILCNGDCMTMGVNPVGNTFGGSIWSKSSDTCNFVTVDSKVPTHWKGYYLTICKDDNKCPYEIVQATRRAEVTVQYGTVIINDLDTTVKFVCSPPPTLTLKTSSVIVKKPASQYSHIKTEFTPTNPKVTMKATQDNKVVTKVALASIYNVELELNTEGAYTTLIIDKLIAKNSDGDEKALISGRCRDPKAKAVMPKKYPKRDPSNKLAVQIKAFFIGTKRKSVKYVAIVTVCKSTLDPYCSQVTCRNRRRKRRDTDQIGVDWFSQSREQYVLSTEVEILDDDHDVRDSAMDDRRMTSFIGILIGCCVLSAVLTAIIVLICMRKNRKEIPHKRFNNVDN